MLKEPKLEVSFKNGKRVQQYSRVDNISRSWRTLKKKAGIDDLQLKDLRTYFNYFLKQHCGFNSKEAGSYIGNSEAVNELNYSPISEIAILEKIKNISLSGTLENFPFNQIN